jgi:CRP-like cAMP-binding protein
VYVCRVRVVACYRYAALQLEMGFQQTVVAQGEEDAEHFYIVTKGIYEARHRRRHRSCCHRSCRHRAPFMTASGSTTIATTPDRDEASPLPERASRCAASLGLVWSVWLGARRLQVEVTKQGESEADVVAKLQEGASFGEMALLYPTARTATVRCVEAGSVCRLGRPAYLFCLRDAPDDNGARPGTASARNSSAGLKPKDTIDEAAPWLVAPLPDREQAKTLLKTVQEVHLEPDEPAFGESEPIGPTIVVVLTGEITLKGDSSKASRDDGLWRVSAFGDHAADATLKPGDVFAIGTPGCAPPTPPRGQPPLCCRRTSRA